MNGTWAGFPSKSWTDGNIIGGAVWQSTWWSAAGFRINISAALTRVANLGHYWSSSFYNSPTFHQSYSLHFGYDGNVTSTSYNTHRSLGLSLRCVQE